MDWKLLFKKITILSWMLCIISLLILIIRYTVSELASFLSWNYPVIWLFIVGCVFCVLAVFWPKKDK